MKGGKTKKMFDDIFDEMRTLQRELDRSFSNFWGSESYKALPDYSGGKRALGMRSPLADLEETDKELIAKFEIPGVDKKDIQLNVTSSRLEVRVEKKQELRAEKKGFYREERSYKGFYRAISLPSEVVPEKAKAKYKDGILEVVLPKVVAGKKNKIEIE